MVYKGQVPFTSGRMRGKNGKGEQWEKENERGGVGQYERERMQL